MTGYPITIITGPTASGKTGLSLELARKAGGAILSADSRMVYQSLDIGTGKPTWEYRQLSHSPWIEPHFGTTSGVTILSRAKDSPEVEPHLGPIYSIQEVDHYLFDLVPPETAFTLADWLARARIVIDHLKQEGQPIFIVGGTGLYLKALIAGYEPPPTDPALRANIEQLATEKIIEELQKVDPLTAQWEASNRRRLVRALEVYRLTSVPISQPHIHPRGGHERFIVETISLPRSELFVRIDQRIEDRLAAGMVEEVEGLLHKGVSQTWFHRLGLEYRVCTEWILAGKKEEGELVARLQKMIHAYARRQETFIRTQLL